MRLSVHLAFGSPTITGGLFAYPAQAGGVVPDWGRGCSVAKNDCSKHSQEYKKGWQDCMRSN